LVPPLWGHISSSSMQFSFLCMCSSPLSVLGSVSPFSPDLSPRQVVNSNSSFCLSCLPFFLRPLDQERAIFLFMPVTFFRRHIRDCMVDQPRSFPLPPTPPALLNRISRSVPLSVFDYSCRSFVTPSSSGLALAFHRSTH